MTQRVLILGAAGRDFHNFNVYFRENADYEVVAFTATQIPNIDDRRYPPELAGERYPEGIPIEPEEDLSRLIKDLKVDQNVPPKGAAAERADGSSRSDARHQRPRVCGRRSEHTLACRAAG